MNAAWFFCTRKSHILIDRLFIAFGVFYSLAQDDLRSNSEIFGAEALWGLNMALQLSNGMPDNRP